MEYDFGWNMIFDAYLFVDCHKNRKLKKRINLRIIVNLN